MRVSRIWGALAGAGVALAMGATAHAGAVKQITGAGSSFAYPLYSAWAEQYSKDTGIELNYQSIGSGGGIRQIEARTVDFGASDAPLTAAELKKQHLVQFPTAMGGVIPTINVPGVKPGEMVLSGPVLADIFLGKVTYWDASAIKKLNPGLKLPHLRITVVHRSDGSGTTFIFTDYLAKVSASWKKSVGVGKAVDWPSSGNVGGKGNEGVAAYVDRIKGGIGYNEYAYVLKNHMNYADMINKAGKRVAPTAENFAAAAANADWKHAPGYYLMLTDQPGAKSWPITGATFVLVPAMSKKPMQTEAVLKFFDWGFEKGTKIAGSLDYIPMPKSVVAMIEKTWREDVKGGGKSLWK